MRAPPYASLKITPNGRIMQSENKPYCVSIYKMAKNANYSVVTEQIVFVWKWGEEDWTMVMFTVWTVVSFEAHTCQPLLSVHCRHCVSISLSKAVSIFYMKKSRWVKNLNGIANMFKHKTQTRTHNTGKGTCTSTSPKENRLLTQLLC